MGIVPIPATIPPIIQVTMIYWYVHLVLLVMLMIVFMKIKEVIVGVMVQDVEVGIRILANIPFTMMDKVFMVMVEVGIGIIPAPIPPIIQGILVDHCSFIVLVMIEV